MMQTFTLKIDDAYYKTVVDFLELLPKKVLKIETPKMSKAQKRILEAVEAHKRGELKTFEMDDKFWDDMDAIIEQVARDNKSKVSKWAMRDDYAINCNIH